MPKIRSYRQVDENDTINGFYSFQGAVPAEAGTFVKIVSGFLGDQHNSLLTVDGQGYANSYSPRWGVPAYVVPVANSGDPTVGMLLYDVRDTDENGEKLIRNRKKAENNNWTISGEGTNIVTKGLFFYSGVNGTPSGGGGAYLHTDGSLSTAGSVNNDSVTRVGTFLGPKDGNGWTFLKLDVK